MFYTRPSAGGELKKRWDRASAAVASVSPTEILLVSRSSDTYDVSAKLVELFEALQGFRKDILTITTIGIIPSFLELIAEEENVESIQGELVDWSPTEKFYHICKSIDDFQLEKLLVSRCWIHDLMGAVENLPICVSLADARASKGMGFPLAYVNTHFEQVFGYSRSDILGRNCRFLQNDLSESNSIAVLSTALKAARPAKVQITNCRKDGSVFKNLLAIKPIFDQDGVYCYVLGLQFSVATEEEASIKLVLLSNLLSMFPETVLETN